MVLTACPLDFCLFDGGAKALQTELRGHNLEDGEHCKSGFTTIDQQRLYATGKSHLKKQKFIARFTAASARPGLKDMKSKRGLHINLENLESDFLFSGIV